MFGISVALEGYGFSFTGFLHDSKSPKGLILTFDIIERLLFATAGLLCIVPETKSDVIGILMMAVLVFVQIARKRRQGKKH